MSEICFECWNKMNNNEYSQKDFIISKDLDLCEEYGQALKDLFLYLTHIFLLPFGISTTHINSSGFILLGEISCQILAIFPSP